jgi:hypothetical protein
MTNELRVRDSHHSSKTEGILVALVGYYSSSSFMFTGFIRQKGTERGHHGNTCNLFPEPSDIAQDQELPEDGKTATRTSIVLESFEITNAKF